ncbi:MAG: hypothetical protein RL419_1191, partial [Actinomycetota bacterium]
FDTRVVDGEVQVRLSSSFVTGREGS